MIQMIEAIFDGTTFHPTAPIDLEVGTRVRITHFDVLDRPASEQPSKRSPQEIFTSTQGSWSHQAPDEIDAQLASQRQLDWGE
jgi:predicted DNA-binding antitoxin AbrB/MazE fold protein